jgi:hypothetical protein
VYFKSALGSAYYFVEMTQAPATASQLDGAKLASSQVSRTMLAAAAQAGGGSVKFVGKLPKPKLEASPITYYIQATTTEFGESQTAEYQAQVVADESECPEGLKVAPIGPAGAVTVFSATTAAVAVPVGFAAGGLAIAGGTLAAVLLGAAGLTTAAVAAGGNTTTTAPTTTTTVTVTTTSTTTTTVTIPPSTTTTTIPNCVFDSQGNPTNCPCSAINIFVPPATGVSATPPPAKTCP